MKPELKALIATVAIILPIVILFMIYGGIGILYGLLSISCSCIIYTMYKLLLDFFEEDDYK